METVFLHLLFMILAKSTTRSESVATSVKYSIISSSKKNHDLVLCAQTCAGAEYAGARINDVTGVCETLPLEWGIDPVIDRDYTYLEKTQTWKRYDLQATIDQRYQWLLPGLFGEEARIEFDFTMPMGANWTGLDISLVNTTNSNFDVLKGEPEEVLAQIVMERPDDFCVFKTFSGEWVDEEYIFPIPFADGSTHRVTIVHTPPQNTFNHLQILFDGYEMLYYSVGGDPSKAQQLVFHAWTGTVFELHNVTFTSG